MTKNYSIVPSLVLLASFVSCVIGVTREQCLTGCQQQYISLSSIATLAQRQNINYRCTLSCQSLPLGGLSVINRQQCYKSCETQDVALSGIATIDQRQTIRYRCTSSCQSLPVTTSIRTGVPTYSSSDCLIQCEVNYRSQPNINIYNACRLGCQGLAPGMYATTTTTTLSPNKVIDTYKKCENICDQDRTNYLRQISLNLRNGSDREFVEKIWVTCKASCFKQISATAFMDQCRAWVDRLQQMYVSQYPTTFITQLKTRAVQACSSQ